MTVRLRILAVAFLALGLPLGALLWWSQAELAEAARGETVDQLTRQARLAGAAVGDRPLADSLADRLGETAGVRVTLVAPDGRVLGDSRIPADRIPELPSHGDRPEVRAALDGRTGSDRRVSETLALPLLYVAVPHPRGAVRVAVPQREVSALADRAGRTVMAVGAGAALLLVLAAGLLQRFVVGPFRELRRDAEALASGDPGRRLRESRGEAGELAQTVNRLADRMEEAEADRARADELGELFDRMDEGVALVDRDGAVRRANAAFRERVGRRDVRGNRFETLFRDPDVSEALEEGLEGRQGSREIRLGDRTVLVDVRPHARGAVAVLRDLTRLRRLEGVRRDFVANVSHELKTPLTSVLGFVEPLADPDLPREKVTEFAGRIMDNATRMRRLVDDLLDLSRIEAGAWEPEAETVRLEDAVRAAWRELARAPDDGQPRLETDLSDAPDVSADREAVRQILRNLLENARRFAPEDGAVRVASRRDDGEVTVTVSDEGPGIPEVHRDRVFERFYRADAGRARNTGGTGLGLSIVKHLVAAHDGEVGVESRVGEGTTVWFRLPAPG